jgi:hypothetical protein
MNWLQILGPPLLMIIGGLITWIIQSKIGEFKLIKEKLQKERRNVYIEILEPYIKLFSDIKGKGQLDAIQTIMSYDYRKKAFELNLFGSDEVIKAYNRMMIHAYSVEKTDNKKPKEMISLWGEFLLEIRKSLGNKKTKLDKYDMLRAMIKDIDNYK